jgi:RNA polymerase sigma factor (sigma-70 family)
MRIFCPPDLEIRDQLYNHELLTREQEVELSRAVQAGLAADPASPDDAAVIAAGRTAEATFVRCNRRLGDKLVQSYERRGLEDADTICGLALLKAARSYDSTLSSRFATYAYWKIKQHLNMAYINERRTVRLPANVLELQAKSRKEQLEPTPVELATINAARLVDRAISTSLTVTTKGDDKLTVGHTIRDYRELAPDELAHRNLNRARISRYLQVLPLRHRQVLSMRFGLAGEGEHTLEEVGVHFGITKQRANQLEKKALDRLRLIVGVDEEELSPTPADLLTRRPTRNVPRRVVTDNSARRSSHP